MTGVTFRPRLQALAAALFVLPCSMVSADVVISQIYGGGGNSGAQYRNDFVELHNNGTVPVSLAGWSLQYASAGGSTWNNKTLLSGVIAPGQYLLLQQAAGAGGSLNLPTPDFIGNIALSATAGKLALVSSTTSLNCSTDCSTLPGVIDFVGFGSASSAEGSPVPALSNTTAALRKNSGCSDSNNNAADFSVAPPTPRNGASVHVCESGGGDPDPVALRIRDIQGTAHLSPKAGQTVSKVPGIVTLVRSNGFYMQDAEPDSDPRSAEGILVYTGSRPTVTVGDAVEVSGTVTEFRPGGSGGLNNLSITEITGPQIAVLSHHHPLPEAILIGAAGRVPPAQLIADPAAGNIETRSNLNLAEAIDFYESLEGMRVRVQQARASGPTNAYGEIPVLADAGLNADLLTARGGIIIREQDFNPERMLLLGANAALPAVNVGDSFAQVDGVFDYSFGNFKLLVTAHTPVQSGNLTAETTRAAASNETTIAAYNVENLSALDSDEKFSRLATQIVRNLRAPDIVAVMEVQDDNGAQNDAVVSANATYARLIASIEAVGGPRYQFRNIDPQDDQDGGQPGGNIRQGFLFNPASIGFVDRGVASAQTAASITNVAGQPQLSHSPGRLQPADAAFSNSRKPLIGEFLIKGQKLFVIANHFNSKGGDQPLFGRYQAPTRSSEPQRHQQANIVADAVTQILDIDPQARVIVLGDINDFQFSQTMQILQAAGLHDLISELPENERYSYVFEGNAQALDHILVSPALKFLPHDYDVVHVNAEFADQASDHDPEVARFVLPLLGQDVTTQLTAVKSGISFNRSNNRWQGTLKLTAKTALDHPSLVLLNGLPTGVRLINASSMVDGIAALKLPPLPAGSSTSFTLLFDNPARSSIGYTLRVVSGNF